MMVSNRGSVLGLLAWQWRAVIVHTAFAATVVFAHKHYGLRIALPTLPLAVVGGAIGIFVSFRSNQAYARWWEGRQLWGRIVNHSRMFVSQVLAYLPRAEGGAPTALQRTLVSRHVAYVHVLRCALRKQEVLADEKVKQFATADEQEALATERNIGHALLDRQLATLAARVREGDLDPNQLRALDTSIAGLLDAQGGCERIKRTPMPRGYAFIAERLIWAYAVLLPATLVNDLGWFTIPVSVLVCLAFSLIGEAGRVLEDPFTMFYNGLPLTALTTTIEADSLRRLGDKDLPPDAQPDAAGILM